MKLVNFNINHYVRVKLTKRGIGELKKQHIELRDMFKKIPDYKDPIVDEDGYTSYQMWELMLKFGHIMFAGTNMPFETEIMFEVEEPES